MTIWVIYHLNQSKTSKLINMYV